VTVRGDQDDPAPRGWRVGEPTGVSVHSGPASLRGCGAAAVGLPLSARSGSAGGLAAASPVDSRRLCRWARGGFSCRLAAALLVSVRRLLL